MWTDRVECLKARRWNCALGPAYGISPGEVLALPHTPSRLQPPCFLCDLLNVKL